MLGVVFLFSIRSLIKMIIVNKKLLYPIKDIDFLSSNVKRYFTSDHFLLRSEGLKFAKFGMLWTKSCAL